MFLRKKKFNVKLSVWDLV